MEPRCSRSPTSGWTRRCSGPSRSRFHRRGGQATKQSLSGTVDLAWCWRCHQLAAMSGWRWSSRIPIGGVQAGLEHQEAGAAEEQHDGAAIKQDGPRLRRGPVGISVASIGGGSGACTAAVRRRRSTPTHPLNTDRRKYADGRSTRRRPSNHLRPGRTRCSPIPVERFGDTDLRPGQSSRWPKRPDWKSSYASASCWRVFITNGPYAAIGSAIGRPVMTRTRPPVSVASSTRSCPGRL